MTTYSATSPYYNTSVDSSGRLGIMTPRAIPVSSTDEVITLTSMYHLRPDLLAYDLYGDSRLWWVFAARNPNLLVSDPLNNFVAGLSIYIPNATNLKEQLGL